MESDRFDNLVRCAFKNASRRSVVRVGIGSLAASAFATLGVRVEEADAKKKKKKKKKGTAPTTCPANLPVTCGTGCCPSTYSLCCVGNLGQQGFGGGVVAVALRAAGDTTCNPPSFTCCPVEQGGGSCGGNFPKCCPATTQVPFGLCAEADDTCCPSTAGGESCPVEFPKCCPSGSQGRDVNLFSRCCRSTESCCQANTDCPGGQECSGNCCRPAVMREPNVRSSGVPRSGIAAR